MKPMEPQLNVKYVDERGQLTTEGVFLLLQFHDDISILKTEITALKLRVTTLENA